MVIAEQQIAVAFDQTHHRIMHVGRDQFRLDAAQFFLQHVEPGRKKRERERVRRGEQNGVGRRALQTAGDGACINGLAHDFGGAFAELLPGFGELGRITGAVNQLRAEPLLQRANAPRKRRLRDVAQLGCPRKAAGLGQLQKVFYPLEFHGYRV